MSLLAVFYTSHYQWLNCKKTSWSIHIEVNYCFICWYTLHSQLNSTEILLVFINHLIKFSIEKGNVYSNTRTSYPCGICHTNCDGLKGVACDSCKHWFQIVKTCPSLISYFYQIDFSYKIRVSWLKSNTSKNIAVIEYIFKSFSEYI